MLKKNLLLPGLLLVATGSSNVFAFTASSGGIRRRSMVRRPFTSSTSSLLSTVEANNSHSSNGYRINGSSEKKHKNIPPPILSVNQQQQQQKVETVKAKEEDEKKKRSALRFMNGLALNSGFLNGIFLSGVLGKVQAVGPVTDSWTKNALAVATGDTSRALFICQVLMSFSLGAFLNGVLLTPNPELFDLRQRKKPLAVAGLCMMTSALLLATATSTAALPNLAFFLVCAANGIQNSYSSFATANMCRTSHFTGTTTDLFTILGQCLRGNTSKKERIPIYTGLTVMFWLGGYLGTRWTKSLADATICLALSSAFYLISSIPIPTTLPSLLKKIISTRGNNDKNKQQ